MTSHNCSEISKFSEAICVGSGILIPACLIPQVVLLRSASVTSYLVPPKRSGSKYYPGDSYNGAKRGLISGATLWRNCHSCCSDVVRPAYSLWGDRHGKPPAS